MEEIAKLSDVVLNDKKATPEEVDAMNRLFGRKEVPKPQPQPQQRKIIRTPPPSQNIFQMGMVVGLITIVYILSQMSFVDQLISKKASPNVVLIGKIATFALIVFVIMYMTS
jgi:hypothetical protein